MLFIIQHNDATTSSRLDAVSSRARRAGSRCAIRKLTAQRDDFRSLEICAEISQDLAHLREREVKRVPTDAAAKIEYKLEQVSKALSHKAVPALLPLFKELQWT